MKKNLFITCVIALMMGTSLMAQNQRNCGTMEYLAAQKAADPGLAARMADLERQTQQWIANHPNRTEAVTTIPVVMHVLYNNSSQNISDARILEQINVLNKDFSRTNADAGNTPAVFQGVSANTMIQFCLAQRDPAGNATTGIVRKSTSTTSFSSNNNVKHNANGGDDAWDRNSYLNIWVCNLGGGLLGYAQFPGGSASTDGVVVLYSSVGGPAAPGTANPYHLGRTATHEVGHWVNLYHIWGDSNCGNDQCSDTPTQQTSNFGCPNFPHVTCSNGPNGDMFCNYMDYTDDACMNNFTAGQTTRIQATINGTRASLKTSQGCVPVGGGTCGIPSGLTASNITAASATLNWNSVTNAVSYNVQYRATGTGTWTSTTSATNSKAVSGLSAQTTYEFQVQTVCSGSSSAFSGSANFTTSGANCIDGYEPNDTKGTAVTVAVNSTLSALITPSGDNDYYKITTVAPATNLQFTLSNLPADYALRLFNSSGTLLKTSNNAGLANEVIKWNTTTAAVYKVRVYALNGVNNSTQCYSLNIAASSTPFRLEGGTETIIDKVPVLSLYPNPVKDILNVNFNSSMEGIVTFNIIDMVGRTVLKTQRISAKGMNNFDLNMSELNKGIYFIEVNNGVDKEIRKVIVSKQ